MRQRAWLGCRWAARGWLVCVVLFAGAMAWTHTGMPAAALAQDKAKEAAKDAAKEDAKTGAPAGAEDLIDDAAPAKAEPAAEPAAAPAPARANAAPQRKLTQPTRPPETSLLSEALTALGWFYTISFLILSFLLVALMVMNLLTARRENVYPSTLVEGFEKHLDEKQYQEAYELAKGDDSYLGQVLAAGLSKLSAGYPEAIEAMQEVG